MLAETGLHLRVVLGELIRVPLLACVLAVSIAGWADEPTLSEMVPMRDGVRLATDVYLPPGPGPFPTSLIRTVYNKDWAVDDPSVMALTYTMAIVVQDCRGRYASEGSDCLFQCDREDGQDTIAWVAAQPWSNARIATEGGSALGIVQYMHAPDAPDALKGMYVVVATPTVCEHTMFINGVFREYMVEGWLAGQGSSWFLDSIAMHPSCDDPFWDSSRVDFDYADVRAPTVHLGGWFDIFSQGTIDAFVGYQNQSAAGEEQHLIMGPWTHGFDFSFPLEGQPDFTFPEPFPGDLIDPISWSLHHLGLLDLTDHFDDIAEVQYYVLGDVDDPSAPGNRWREATTWPVPAVPVRLYLQSDGGLSESLPAENGGATTYTYDPQDPCPTVGGANLIWDAGPRDQRSIEVRNDVIVFQTARLTEPLEVTGRLSARLFVSTDAPDTDVHVRLCDVYPDGKSMLILDAPARLSNTGAYTPNTIIPVDVDLWSTSIIFNRGHRLRISVTSSNWPRFRANPNDGSVFGPGDPRVAEVDIHHSRAYPSHITIPDPNRTQVGQLDRWVPHITRPDGGFSSHLLARNRSSQPQSLVLTPFLEDGSRLPPVVLNVSGQALLTADIGAAFSPRPSHLAISEGADFTVSVAYTNTFGTGSPAHISETAVMSRGWALFAGNWDVVFDGFACVNTGSRATDVRVRHLDAQGNVLAEHTVESALASGAKTAAVIGAPAGSEFARVTGDRFELWADEPLAVTALRGTPPDSDLVLLWQNPALPLD